METVEIPTEFLTADPHTDAELQGNLLQDYDRKFEQLPEDQKLSKLCCDAGLKIVEKGQFFITFDEEEGPHDMKNLCREYTLPRSEEASRVRGWILGNRKIAPVLDVKVCLHQERYGIEILIESLYRDGTASRVRIVNGVNKYVTETSETISLESVEHRVTRKPAAKAKPRPKFAVTLSPISILLRERKWIDINPERIRQDCFAVSKAMIRLLRLDQFLEKMMEQYDLTTSWKNSRKSSMVLRKGLASKHFVCLRASQGHSGGILVDPALQNNVLLPEEFTEYIYHIGNF